MGSLSVENVKTIVVKPVIASIPEDSKWKKTAVSIIPLFGAVVGLMSLKEMKARLTQVSSYEAKLSLQKVIHSYHSSVSMNAFIYGVTALGFGYENGHLGLLVMGACQLIVGGDQVSLMRKSDLLITQLVAGMKQS